MKNQTRTHSGQPCSAGSCRNFPHDHLSSTHKSTPRCICVVARSFYDPLRSSSVCTEVRRRSSPGVLPLQLLGVCGRQSSCPLDRFFFFLTPRKDFSSTWPRASLSLFLCHQSWNMQSYTYRTELDTDATGASHVLTS